MSKQKALHFFLFQTICSLTSFKLIKRNLDLLAILMKCLIIFDLFTPLISLQISVTTQNISLFTSCKRDNKLFYSDVFIRFFFCCFLQLAGNSFNWGINMYGDAISGYTLTPVSIMHLSLRFSLIFAAKVLHQSIDNNVKIFTRTQAHNVNESLPLKMCSSAEFHILTLVRTDRQCILWAPPRGRGWSPAGSAAPQSPQSSETGNWSENPSVIRLSSHLGLKRLWSCCSVCSTCAY